MIDLDSPSWDTLSACYSAPRAVAALREVVASGTLGEAWENLRAEALHQGTVYDVTSAAIPHLLALAPVLTPAERAGLWVEVAFWITAGADAADADLAAAEAGALDALRTADPDSYLALACVAFAGHPTGTALWSFLSAGEGYVGIVCPGCEAEYEVDGFGDPLLPPGPAPEPPVSTRDAPAWTALAPALESVDLGPGWGEHLRAAASVARAGLPPDTPAPAVWCLIAAMVALRGDAPWARTLARLAGHFRCDECGSTWVIGDLVGDAEPEPVPVAAPATADGNGFRPATPGPPRSFPLGVVRTELPSPTLVPAAALACATLPDGRTILAALDAATGTLHRWQLPDTYLSEAPAAAAPLSALTSTMLPDGRAVFVAGGPDGAGGSLHRWDAESGRPLPAPSTSDGAAPGAAVLALASVVVPVPARLDTRDKPWLAALRDGRTVVVSGDAAGAVRLWDPLTAAPLGELFRVEGTIRCITVVPGGDVVIVSGDLAVDAWSPAAVTGERSTMTPSAARLDGIGHRDLVAVAPAPATGFRKPVLLADRAGSVSLWETFGVRLGDPLPAGQHGAGVVAAAAVTGPDGSLVVAVAGGTALRLWSPSTGGVTVIALDAPAHSLLGLGTAVVVGTSRGVVVHTLSADPRAGRTAP